MRRKYMIAMVVLGFLLLVGQVSFAAVTPLASPSKFSATVTPGATGSSATLTWTRAGNETGFTIEVVSFGLAKGKTSYKVSGTATSFTHTGLAPGSAYHYRIKGVARQGSSAWSPTITVNTP